MDSSVAFESLFFSPKIILAYHNAGQKLPTEDYMKLLFPFSDSQKLSELLSECLEGKIRNSGNQGREFFKSLYGQVNGTEVEQIANIRNWLTLSGESQVENSS